mgnify:CR=1 FL=1
MERRLSSYTGCLLGLAVGDGLGHGPERVNGFLSVSGYTQMAAYACNGLLVGLTRGQLSGTMAPPVRYVAQALQEWARHQLWRQSGPVTCWISRSPRLDYRRCPENDMLDVLAAGELGTMEDHSSRLTGPGALMTAPAAALFYDPERMPRREFRRLAAESAALTHGDPESFLSGAALSYILSRILWDGEENLDKLTREAAGMLRTYFAKEYRQTRVLCRMLRDLRSLTHRKEWTARQALDTIGNDTAAQILMGALYICMAGPGDFEECMALACEWSAAGAAVAGAILGALHGEEAIPEELVEELECAGVLRELALDLFGGCPMMKESRVFDIEWDEKYHVTEL